MAICCLQGWGGSGISSHQPTKKQFLLFALEGKGLSPPKIPFKYCANLSKTGGCIALFTVGRGLAQIRPCMYEGLPLTLRKHFENGKSR